MATWATSFWQPGTVFRARTFKTTASAAAEADADPMALSGLPNDDIYFYSKRIDNSRLVRQADTHARGEWSAIAGVGAAALLIGGMMIAPGVAGVMDSYKIQDLKKEQAQLLNERRKLEVQEEMLVNAARLEQMAPENNLVRPAANQMIRLQPKNNHSFAMNGFKSR
jgi:hypothetical protein